MNEKRIAVNTLFYIPGKVGGSEIFLRYLVTELSRLGKDLDYYIFANEENEAVFKDLPNNFTIIKCPFNANNRVKRVFWEQFILPFQCLYYKIDVLHSPGYTTPLITHCKKITTIFDLNYYYHPEDFSRLQLIIYRILIPMVGKFSDIILTHSHKSKKEISKVFGVSDAKIVVVYPGVSEKFWKRYTRKEISKVISKYNIKSPYILSNAVSHPHKNLTSLIYAFKYLVDKYETKQHLVLLGFPGRDQKRLEMIIREQNLEGRIFFTGWIDPDEVPYFYQGAEVFVFPSLYEGFGLPNIEAMASGVPLVASNASCIPEVVGDGGLLLNAKNSRILAQGIWKVLGSLIIRKSLKIRGEKRAKRFKWEKFAKEVRSLYLSEVNI